MYWHLEDTAVLLFLLAICCCGRRGQCVSVVGLLVGTFNSLAGRAVREVLHEMGSYHITLSGILRQVNA